MKNLHAWLKEHTIRDVLNARSNKTDSPPLKISKGAKMIDSLDLFTKNKIHSLLFEDGEKMFWLRLEDVLHLVDDLNNLEEFTEQELSEVVKYPVETLNVDTDLLVVLRKWDVECLWIPPLAVTNDSSHILAILTSADLLRYIYLYAYHLTSLVNIPASCLDWIASLPLLNRREPSIKGLQMLLEPSSPGVVGLVNQMGVLLGSVTLPEFLPLPEDLDIPICDLFASREHSLSLVTFNEMLSFGDVLHRILQGESHHVWKLNEAGTPVGIVHVRHMIAFIQKCMSSIS